MECVLCPRRRAAGDGSGEGLVNGAANGAGGTRDAEFGTEETGIIR